MPTPPARPQSPGMVLDPALRTVMLGTAALGFVAGCLGTFAVLRRQSLLGDAVSHAALPGVVLAFLLFGKWPLALLAGAAASGLLAMLAVAGSPGTAGCRSTAPWPGPWPSSSGPGLLLKSLTPRDRGRPGSTATCSARPPPCCRERHLGDRRRRRAGPDASWSLFWKEFKLLTFDRGVRGRPRPAGRLARRPAHRPDRAVDRDRAGERGRGADECAGRGPGGGRPAVDEPARRDDGPGRRVRGTGRGRRVGP